MKIESLKDLQKVIQLCRKTGVNSIKIDNVEFHLGAEPRKVTTSVDYGSDFPEANIRVPQFTGEIDPPETIKTDELTQEQLMFYSAAPEGGRADLDNQ